MGLFNDLNALESAGLIQVAKVEPDLEYLFRHSMIQDAAYAALLESDRKRLHLSVGKAIEHLYPERKTEFAAILGNHFKEAGDEEHALTYFIIAGDEALTVYANAEAEMQYRSALELHCCSGPEIAWLYSGLGEALYRQNRFVEAIDTLRTGIEIYKQNRDYDGMARQYARLARVEWYASLRPEGLRTCLIGMKEVRTAPDSQGKAMLIHETARAYYFNGNSEKALPLCRQALKLAEQFGDTFLQADSLATLGILAGVTPEESLEALSKAVELAEANGYMQVAMRAYINLGSMTRTWRGDNETALKCYKRSSELGRMRGVASEELLGLTSYISCLFAPGRLKEVRAELPRMEALALQIPDPEPSQALITYIKAILTIHEGDWDSGVEVFRQSLQRYRGLKNKESELSVLDELSWMILEKQRWGEPADLGEVEMLLGTALEMFKKEDSNELIWVYPRMAMLKARQGKIIEAEQWIEKSQQRISGSRSIWDERFLQECTMEVNVTRRNWDEALSQIENITRTDGRLGFRVNYARSLLCWGDMLITQGASGDLETAAILLRQSIDEFNAMGIGHYPEIAQHKLKIILEQQHARTLDHEKMTRELKKARRVQESMLPKTLPQLAGWDLTAMLEPAHETSGDFYDFLTLPDEKLGMVIADVTDKGTGAALYMALSRSLWRTFAVNHPDAPQKTLDETNQRIMADTHGGLFITVFYGILDPQAGVFTYCSAGHLPGLLLRSSSGEIEQLQRTGIPLGVLESAGWSKQSVILEPGDALVLYTDGITDAQTSAEEFYGLERLEQICKKAKDKSAIQIRELILGDLRTWVGQAEQYDDISLIVLVREK
jgi:serine phosphatase RsbU (regulator of sigma subunit)